MTDWHFGYEFNTPIVGESNYQDALRKSFNEPNAFRKGESAFIDVDLTYEPNNPYDKNAVAVVSTYGTLGYLSKQDAIRYRHLCEGERDTLSVRCKIYGGSKGLYGAWVDLNLEDLAESPQSLKKYKDITSQPSPPSLPEKPKNKISMTTIIVGVLVLFFVFSMVF
ncbi:HIRAN domain-containing protein [Psychrobacter sp. Marseille-P5312]|uniref:HIRAN domain-containing protein n=1 Tax=Psychrobacter sp. Marseille-P5312 TaxID=2086574 RepID=UPI000CF69991|nr:HIRAN domain-containing protein [Psychrobacter sp. Marseille-P5312]